MDTYRFRIFYEWRGRTHSDPFANEKSAEEVAEALFRFPGELRTRLDGDGTSVEVTSGANPKEVFSTVTTSVSEEGVMRALERTCIDWRLFGDKLK